MKNHLVLTHGAEIFDSQVTGHLIQFSHGHGLKLGDVDRVAGRFFSIPGWFLTPGLAITVVFIARRLGGRPVLLASFRRRRLGLALRQLRLERLLMWWRFYRGGADFG